MSSRWLTLEPAAQRILEQWPALVQYFLIDLPKKVGAKKMANVAKEIIEMLKNPRLKSELIFVIELADVFQKYNGFFQNSKPLIHLLYEESHNLVKKLLKRIFKPTVELANLTNDTFSSKNFGTLDEIVLDNSVKKELQKLSKGERLIFMQDVQNCYFNAAKYFFTKSCLFVNKNSKHLRCLNPKNIKSSESISDIQKVAEMLPTNDFSAIELNDEWNFLVLENIEYEKDERIDIFWNKVFQIKNNFNSCKYPTLKKIVTAALSISHGAADIERGFSASKRMMPDEKASMSLRMFNSRKYIKDGLKLYQNKPELVPINNDLLFDAENARKNYHLYLENVRQKNEEKAREKVKNCQEQNEKKRKRNEKEEEARKKIKILESDYKNIELEEESKKKTCR